MKKPSAKVLLVVAVLLIGGYLFLKRSSPAQAAYSGAPGPTGSAATSADPGTSDSGAATTDLLDALGAQNSQLLAGLLQSEQTFQGFAAGYATSSNTGQFGSQTSVYTGVGGSASPPFDSQPGVPSQQYLNTGNGIVSAPSGYFQNEQGYATITTPSQLATGSTPSAGKAYAQ